MKKVLRVIDLRRMARWFSLPLCVFVGSCSEQPDQALEEYNGASFLSKVIGFYERRFPDVPFTNLQQAFLATGTPYPDRYHHYFQTFGKDAGFKNSIYEKYVVVALRFTNHAVSGEIVLLNAQPFPNREGKYGRMIISKTPLVDTGWDFKWYPEEQVQQIFTEAGQSIPKAVPMPPPSGLPPVQRPPLRVRVEEYFGDITRNWGLGTEAGKYLMWACFGFTAILAFVLVAIFWGRRVKRKT